jgi:hypothetical protein
MRRLAAGLVLVILPFSGVRVICVEVPADAAAPQAPSQQADDISDCEHLCALHHVTSSDADSGSGTRCALSADPSCFNLSGTLAIVPAYQPFTVSIVASAIAVDAPQFYLEPAVAHLGPPPKSVPF